MSQSGSFIPQQQPVKSRAPRRRRVYLIGYVIYVLFFAVLLVVAALFVWNWQLGAQLASAQQALNQERSSFKQSDMILVQETDARLALISYVLDRQPAVTRVLNALEETTVESIQITNFTVVSTEASADSVLLTYTGSTDTFDAVLTQRDAMAQNNILSNAKIVDVAYTNEALDETGLTSGGLVTYEVTLEIPLTDIQFQGRQVPRAPVINNIEPPATFASEEDNLLATSSPADVMAPELIEDNESSL